MQPYAEEFDLLPVSDPFNRNARQDMFFKPRRVKTLSDQLDKWWAAIFWYYTPLPALIFFSNYFWFCFDFLFISGEA